MPHDSEHDKGETSGPGSSSDEPRLRTSDNVVKYLQASFYYGIKGWDTLYKVPRSNSN